jgi:hypothetical protein
VLWCLRRLYLKLLPGGAVARAQDQLTAASSIYNPWDQNAVLKWAGRVLGWPLWWWPVFRLQDLFSSSRRGHAAMFLARKGTRANPSSDSRRMPPKASA